MSQSWTRDGVSNPSEKVIAYKEFLEGELDSTIIHVFGREKYDQFFSLAQQELKKKK
jgi:hypothetical protein